MAELAHTWGNDLTWSADGDLQVSTGSDEARERVLRRLLTVAGTYLWQQDYGAGLPARVGSVLDIAGISGVVRRQMLLEQGVAQDPPPEVEVDGIFQGAVISIQYTDAATGEIVPLGLRVTG